MTMAFSGASPVPPLEPSEGEGSSLGGETDNDDLEGGDDDFDY